MGVSVLSISLSIHALKTVAGGHGLGKKYSTANKITIAPAERACMLKEIKRTETIMNFTVEEEDVTKDTSEEEEFSTENDSDQTEERDSSSSLNTTSIELSSEYTS